MIVLLVIAAVWCWIQMGKWDRIESAQREFKRQEDIRKERYIAMKLAEYEGRIKKLEKKCGMKGTNNQKRKNPYN